MAGMGLFLRLACISTLNSVKAAKKPQGRDETREGVGPVSSLLRPPSRASIIHVRFVFLDFQFWHESDFHYFPPPASPTSPRSSLSRRSVPRPPRVEWGEYWASNNRLIIIWIYCSRGGAVSDGVESTDADGDGRGRGWRRGAAWPLWIGARRETFRSRYP